MFCHLCTVFLIGFLIVTGDLESTVENPWSKYLLNSKFEEDLEIEFMGRYKGISAEIDNYMILALVSAQYFDSFF
jgi:hypothetical protein